MVMSLAQLEQKVAKSIADKRTCECGTKIFSGEPEGRYLLRGKEICVDCHWKEMGRHLDENGHGRGIKRISSNLDESDVPNI